MLSVFIKLYVPYSLIHCKTIRTGIHKGNPLVPFVESGYAVLLKTLFAKLSARTGRFGNPCGWVSDGSFPYFCPYRTVLHLIETNRFWRIKFSCIFVAKPRNTHVLLHFANFNIEKFYFRQNCSAPEKVQFFRRARSTKRSNTFRIASFEDVKRRLKLPFIGRFGSIKCNTRVPARHERKRILFI